MYSAQVLDHFEHPRNAGELPGASATAKVENPVCGDVLEFSVKVDNGVIMAAGFRAQGCVASVAAASKLSEIVDGKTVTAAKQVKSDELIDSLDGLPEGSIHAAHLAIEALFAALNKL